MAANVARQTEMRHGADDGALAMFDQALAAAGDVPAAFEALAARADGLGLDALLCRRQRDGEAPRDIHNLSDRAASLFADAGFRRAWPMERAALAQTLPLCWTVVAWPGDWGSAARDAMSRLSSADVEAGVTLAARGPQGGALVVTAFGSIARLSALGGIELDLWVAAVVRFLARLEALTLPATASPNLSRREIEILDLSAKGLTAAAAAGTLGVTEATIKFHLAGARRKLGVRNTAEAVARFYALKERRRQ